MECKPLPALPLEIDLDLKKKFDTGAEWLTLIGHLMQLDRLVATSLISKLQTIFKSKHFIASLVLSFETENFLVGLVQMGKNLGNMVGLILESEIGFLHAASFRSALLLPFQYCDLQIEFFSNFFAGTLFNAAVDQGIDHSMASLKIEEEMSLPENLLESLPSLRGKVRNFIHGTVFDRRAITITNLMSQNLKFCPNTLILFQNLDFSLKM